MALFGGDESALSIVLRLKDEASAKLKEVESRFSSFQKSIEPAAEASRKFALGLGAAGVAVGALGGFAIKAAADMEQTKIAFETMLGSAEKANTFIRDLVQFAKTTPFELKGLEDSAKKLLAFGFTQNEVLPSLKALGDIAAGVGTEKLPQLILAFGQVKAATRLTGMELRQFTEAGVPLLDELAKQLGVTAAEVQELVSEGKIGFGDVQKALVSLTSEGGRFNDLMDKQAKSLGGMISNLKDAWDIFLRGEGQKLLEWAKQFVEIAIYIIQNVLPVWVKRIEQLVTWFAEHKLAILIVVGAILGALVPAILSAVASFAALAVALAPFIIGGAIVGGLVAGILWLVQNWEYLKTKGMEIWDSITGYIADKMLLAYSFIQDIGAKIRAAWDALWEGVKTIVQNGVNFVMEKIQSIINAYNRMKEIVSKPIQIISNTVSSISSKASSLLGFETGGTVPGPVGQPVPIIAHGQEQIIPASSAKGMSGAVFNVSINNPTVRTDDDLRKIEDSVERVFRRLLVNYKFSP